MSLVRMMASQGNLSLNLQLLLPLCLKKRMMLLGDMCLVHCCFLTSALCLRSSVSGWPPMLSASLVIFLFVAKLYH
jgi:hypothetical protein